MMKLTLIRHTSVGIQKGICYGSSDVELAVTFPKEAENVQEKLSGENFDQIYTSPLKRCSKLAFELYPEADIRIDKRLVELDFGSWEMLRWDSVYSSKRGKAWFSDYVNIKCLKGESFTDLIARCENFLNELKAGDCSHVAVFTHAGVIRAMLSLNQDISPEDSFYVPLAYGQVLTLDL